MTAKHLPAVFFIAKKIYVLVYFPALILQMPWVIQPMGQKVHQVRGLYKAITIRPMRVEVSIMLYSPKLNCATHGIAVPAV